MSCRQLSAFGRELVEMELRRLPANDVIEVGWEPEYYGAAHLIAGMCGRNDIRPYAPKTWLHGWQFIKPLKFINQIIFWGDEKNAHMVHTREQRDFARSQGYKFAEAIGAPFTYVGKSSFQRIPNSLLVMPPHGIPQAEIKDFPYDYLDYMADLRKEFDVVAACIHPHDCKNGQWPRELSKLGIPWTTGASVDDRNALFRMRALFDLFDFMTTNAVGSHVAYSALCGCKISVSGPFHKWDKEMYADDRWYDDKQELLEYALISNDENHIRNYYGHLFCRPSYAAPAVAWAEKELGSDCRKSPSQLARLFGWTKTARILDDLRGKKYAYAI
jgi:hypothetical protein